LFFQRPLLVNPRIAGRADLFKRFAIGIRKMKCIRDMDRAVIFRGRLGDGELTGFVIQFRHSAAGDIMPRPGSPWHEANPIGPIAIIVTHNISCGAIGRIKCEACGEWRVEKWIPVGRPFKRKLEDAPLRG